MKLYNEMKSRTAGIPELNTILYQIFCLIFYFIFSRTIQDTYSFQENANDAVSIRLLQLGKGQLAKLLFVVILVRVKLASNIQRLVGKFYSF